MQYLGHLQEKLREQDSTSGDAMEEVFLKLENGDDDDDGKESDDDGGFQTFWSGSRSDEDWSDDASSQGDGDGGKEQVDDAAGEDSDEEGDPFGSFHDSGGPGLMQIEGDSEGILGKMLADVSVGRKRRASSGEMGMESLRPKKRKRTAMSASTTPARVSKLRQTKVTVEKTRKTPQSAAKTGRSKGRKR